MNVENRKLFANRDARKRLAEMGGILASSPELMGEAMKFANGGGGELSYIVSNIPGLVAQYEYVRVDVPTMQMLNDRFPQLMQQATVEEESMVPSGVRTRARPQTILGTRISRMMETQQAAPEEVVLESAPITSGEQPSLMDRIRTTVQSAQSVNPIEDAFKEIGPAITSAVPGLSQYEGQPNPYVEALKNAGLSEDPVAFDPQGLMSPPMYDVSSLEVPKMGDILASEQLISAAPPGVGTMPVTLTSEEIQNAIASGNAEILELAQQQGLLDREIEKAPAPKPAEKATPEAPPTNLALLSDSRLEAERLSRKSIVPNFVMDVIDNVQTAAGTVGAGAADVVGSTLAALGATDAGAKFLESAKNRRDVIATINAAERKRDSETVADVAEVVAEQERRDPTGPMSEIDDGTGTDFSLVPKEAIAKAVEKNDPKAASAALMKSIAGVDVHGGTTPPLVEGDGKSPPSDDKPDAPKTRKQRMLESVDMISELFGIREKDKAEDMYDLMATIGFAMASGESPNAMKNIADAFLVGAQMKRADKKEDKKLDQAIRTLAVKDVLEQESDERALAQLLAKEQRQDRRALDLYAEKLRIKKEMDPTSPAGRYLSSELGDAVLEIYAEVLKDETINPDDKGAEFFKRVGDKNATQFLGLTGFSAMGGGVGSGVTPTKSKLDFGDTPKQGG